MYKIIFFLITIPFLSLGQNTERNQKLQKRNDRYNSRSFRTPSNNWRYTPRTVVPRYYTPYYNPPIIYDYWNQPYIYSPWRSRIWDPTPPPRINNYYYNDRVTTPQSIPQVTPQIQFTPVKHTLGMTFPINPSFDMGMGVYYAVGRENVFVVTYKFPVTSIDDYENISIADVTSWNDRYITTDKNFSEFTVAYGKRFGNLTPYLGLGVITKRSYPRYFDEMYILGYDGYYNISGTRETQSQVISGLLLDFDMFNLNLSGSILNVPNVSLGFGFTF